MAVPAAPSQLHQMAGYFAIVGMSRLQCLLGDYYECEFFFLFFFWQRLIVCVRIAPWIFLLSWHRRALHG